QPERPDWKSFRQAGSAASSQRHRGRFPNSETGPDAYGREPPTSPASESVACRESGGGDVEGRCELRHLLIGPHHLAGSALVPDLVGVLLLVGNIGDPTLVGSAVAASHIFKGVVSGSLHLGFDAAGLVVSVVGAPVVGDLEGSRLDESAVFLPR